MKKYKLKMSEVSTKETFEQIKLCLKFTVSKLVNGIICGISK